MKRIIWSIWAATSILICSCGNAQPYQVSTKAERWSAEKANEWYARQGWCAGVNYVTSTAINQIEMWQAETFDSETIDRELGWAEDLGFNTIRIFLQDLVWEADPDGFKQRVDQFLSIAAKHNQRVVITFFTNGGKNQDPKLGKQPESVKGIHNSQWTQSPGATSVNDPSTWGRLETYVKDVLTAFKDDERILLWCLYNEPESVNKGAKTPCTLALMRKVFEWAREVDPSQPLTAPLMLRPGSTPSTRLSIVSFLGENCDIITFHTYEGSEEVEQYIKMLKDYGRPMICTEYMGRPKSTFEDVMPIFKRENIGAVSWGLIAGKCNFHLQWTSQAGDPEPQIWFHDIFRVDGTPYSESEVTFIKQMTGKAN